MQIISANGIELAVDTFGNPRNRPLVLIMGLSCQMVAWPHAFCEMLAAGGHWVIRFDNRDCGLSSKIEAGGIPKLQIRPEGHPAVAAPAEAPYTLSDMAADTAGLMDALGLQKAHVCGLSMGGMIAQTLALEHPRRVISLTSMQSTTGHPDLPPPTAEARAAMIQAPPGDRDGYIHQTTEVYRVFSGGSPLFDETVQQKIGAASFDRCFYPWGFLRQIAAITASGSRKTALRTLKTPTLIIHGTHDTLVPPEHGRATAQAIPGAHLQMVDGLGHGFAYPALWRHVADLLQRHTMDTHERQYGR